LKYILLGAIPPPLGGVSVYCMRKLEYLTGNGLDVRFFDSRCKINLIRLIFYAWLVKLTKQVHEIEVNVSNPNVLLALILSGVASSCVFYDHNSSRRLLSSNYKTFVFTFFCRKVKRVKTVNAKLVDNYDALLNGKVLPITVESPFLPPATRELEIARDKYPEKYRYLLDDGSKNIVLASAWKAISTDSEVDLYGIKDTLCIYANLVKIYPSIKFILMIGESDHSNFYGELKLIINKLNVFDNFEFIEGGLSQVPLLKRTVALLRLTKTDGDSVSVREAMYYGVKVIATNVSERPEGVELVSVGDINGTQKALQKAFDLTEDKL